MAKKYFYGPLTMDEIYLRSKHRNNGCIEWQDSVARAGYAQVRRGKKCLTVSRVVMNLTQGFDLSSKLCILHRCDNPLCVNSEHLFAGTHGDNVRDKIRKKRHNFGQRVWKARLTENDVRKIFSLYKSGVGKSEIARRFSIAYSSIWRILNQQAWKHVNINNEGIPLKSKEKL